MRTQVVAAISTELLLQRDYLQGEPLSTIYFGGGTPSLLTREEIDLLLNTIRQSQAISEQAEVTLEANPDDLTSERLKEFKEAGINRLSIGIQTFNTNQLKFLNRIHDERDAIKSFNAAREAGFNNISIDLMYALPGETIEDLKIDIQKALSLNPEHISCYSLTIEEKTAFGKWAATGKLKPETDEVSASHLEIVMHELIQAGYDHYEISNFARPGFQSNHNSNYWRGVKYLGVGPSAHSFNETSRQYNIANNNAYLKALQAEKIPFEQEVLSIENKINEYILTSLRTSWGVDTDFIKQQYQYDLLNENKDYLSTLIDKKLVMLQGNILKLTHTGKLMADKISSDLFVA